MSDTIQKAVDEANSKGLSITLIQPKNSIGRDTTWRCLVSYYGKKDDPISMSYYGHYMGIANSPANAIRVAVKLFIKEYPHIYSKPQRRKRQRLRRERL